MAYDYEIFDNIPPLSGFSLCFLLFISLASLLFFTSFLFLFSLILLNFPLFFLIPHSPRFHYLFPLLFRIPLSLVLFNFPRFFLIPPSLASYIQFSSFLSYPSFARNLYFYFSLFFLIPHSLVSPFCRSVFSPSHPPFVPERLNSTEILPRFHTATRSGLSDIVLIKVII